MKEVLIEELASRITGDVLRRLKSYKPVYNAPGTKDFHTIDRYASWKDLWDKNNDCKHEFDYCLKCGEKGDLEGAHLLMEGCEDKGLYIAPLCQECNNPKSRNYKETFYVERDRLVRVTTPEDYRDKLNECCQDTDRNTRKAHIYEVMENTKFEEDFDGDKVE